MIITMMPAATLKHLSLLSPPPLRSFPPISSLLLPSSSYLRPPSLPSLRSVPHPPLRLALMSAFTTPPPPPRVSSSSACFCFRADRERPRDSPSADAHGDDDDDDDEEEGDLAFHVRDGSTSTFPSSSAVPDRLDVLGLGQAMVDFSGMVDDAFLERLGLQKGTRKLVNHEERGRVLRAMDGCSYKAAAGGSLSNSLVALSRLGTRPIGGPPLSIAMAGSVGSDPLGEFYRAKLRRANVNFLSAPVNDGTTGTVIVLTTPDAQRTMLAYQVRHDSTGSPSTTSKNNMIIDASPIECKSSFAFLAGRPKSRYVSDRAVQWLGVFGLNLETSVRDVD